MKKNLVFLLFLTIGMSITINAQTPIDTIKTEVRSYVARNFSADRTFNLYWETNPSHNYTLKHKSNKYEKGKVSSEQTVKFGTTIPILQKRGFTLYGNLNADFYLFNTKNRDNAAPSSMFKENDESYSYFKAGITGTYFLNIFNKPLMLRASVSGDGWYKGFEKIDASLTAMIILKRTNSTHISVGMHGMLLFDLVPAVPIIVVTHQFNPKWGIDITLPSKIYTRYHFLNGHRISVGSSMENELFYYRPDIEELPKTVLFTKATIKFEVVYEYIISDRFYLIARGGGNKNIMSGIFKINRSGDGNGKPLLEYSRPTTLFFNLGFSYNIFK